MQIPALDTDRLTLRGPTLADVDDAYAMWSDPAVVRFIGGRVFNHEEVWGRVCRYVGHWALHGHGFWCIRERAGGAYVGEVGFGAFRRQLEPPVRGGVEAGWALASSMQGRGYAREALAAALAWGDARWASTVCMIDPRHARSIALAERVGYREVVRARYHDEDTVVFERRRR